MEPSGAGEKTNNSVGAQGTSQSGAALLPQRPVLGQQLKGVGVERDLPALHGLGLLLGDPRLGLGVAAVDPQDRLVDVEMVPAQRGHLAPARPGDHGEPQQQAPLGIRPGRVQQRRGFRRARRVRLGRRRGGRLGHRGLVHPEVAPADGAFEDTADDVVNLAGGARAQRPADMSATGPPGAQVAAAVQAGVEALEQFGVELARQHGAEGRQDVEADQVVVPFAGGVAQLGDVEPLLDGLADGDGRLRVLVLVDLALKFGQDLLGSVVRRCCLAELPHLAGQRIRTRIHHRPVRAARKLGDMSAWTALPGWHGTTIPAVRATTRATPSTVRRRRQQTRWSDAVPPAGFEPAPPPPEGGALSPELRGPVVGSA